MTRVLALVSAFGCMAAGAYLLVATDNLLETLMRGIGIYFVAKGLYYLGAFVEDSGGQEA